MDEEAIFNAHVLYQQAKQTSLKYTDLKMMYLSVVLGVLQKFQMLEGSCIDIHKDGNFYELSKIPATQNDESQHSDAFIATRIVSESL